MGFIYFIFFKSTFFKTRLQKKPNKQKTFICYIKYNDKSKEQKQNFMCYVENFLLSFKNHTDYN